MVRQRTLDLLADKLAVAVELAQITHDEASYDGVIEWHQVLADLHKLAETVGSATDTAVRIAREVGVSWDGVGQALAMSKQGAQQRWGR